MFSRVDDFGTEIAKGAIREIDRGVKTASEIGAGALNQIGSGVELAKGDFMKIKLK